MAEYRRLISNLIPGEEYIVRVRSVNANNIASEWNDSIILDVPDIAALPSEGLLAVDNISVIAGIRMLYVRFDANTQRVLDGYNIYVSDVSGFTADSTTLVKEVAPETLVSVAQYAPAGATPSGTLLDMVSGSTYYLKIRTKAVGGSLSEPTQEFSGTPGQVDNNTIESMVIDKLDTGNLNSIMTLNTGQIQTADTSTRFVLDNNNFIGYRSNETEWFNFALYDAATPNVPAESVTFTAADGSTLTVAAGLDIAGTVTMSGEIAGTIDLHSTGDAIIELGDAAGVNKLSIRDSTATEVALIDSDGKLGLGNPSPAYNLDIVGTGMKIIGVGATAGGNILMEPSTGNMFNITSSYLTIDASSFLRLEGNTLELSAGPTIGHAELTLETSNGSGLHITGSNTNRRIAIGNNITTTLATAQAVIYSSASTYSPLVLRGAASQTANLQEWQDNSGTVVASISAAGNLSAANFAYSSYTPTITGWSAGDATVTAEYAQLGKLVFVKFDLVYGSTTTATAPISISLPVNASGVGWAGMNGIVEDASPAALAPVFVEIDAVGTFTLRPMSTVTALFGGIEDATPWTWATSDTISAHFVYEAA